MNDLIEIVAESLKNEACNMWENLTSNDFDRLAKAAIAAIADAPLSEICAKAWKELRRKCCARNVDSDEPPLRIVMLSEEDFKFGIQSFLTAIKEATCRT